VKISRALARGYAILRPVTGQQVARILKSYPKGRKAPSAWQTVAITIRPASPRAKTPHTAGWAITFYDVWDRQQTCFNVADAEAVAWEHREAARYAGNERKRAFKAAPALPELAWVAK
jgi:hypothetical protein